jgi:hypothetical protein
MTTTQLRKRVQARIRTLSPQRLRLADDFLAYLQDREDNAATRELLAIPGLRRSIERGLRQAAAGKTVPLAKVRRNV